MTNDTAPTTPPANSNAPASGSPSRALVILRRTLRIAGRVLRWCARASRKILGFSFYWGFWIALYTAPLWLIAGFLLWRESKTSKWQAHYLTRIAKEATFSVAPGPASEAWFPSFGPYDERLGYTRIPGIIENLSRAGYQVESQARQSPRFLELGNLGLNPPFREKTRTGITILDRHNTTIYSAYRPERVYDRFDLVPDLVVKSLLYIENREILEQQYPTKNPAIEWDRLGFAVLEKARQILNPDLNAPGGSTIATQLEKYRHSREGRTSGIKDKLLQMASASLRAYMYGEQTLETRKSIVLQYINSIPLAALPGYGEVNGLGDGLWAWYGINFDDANRQFAALRKAGPETDIAPYAKTFKQMLSLFIAHRRPSYYLLAGINDLNQLTNVHLDLLEREGIISSALRDASKGIKLSLQRAAPTPKRVSFVQRKAANAIRTRLLQLMSYPQLYDLDQVDLTVRSTMDNEASEAVTDVLKQIKDSESVKKLGLNGARNLDRGDPSKVIYSLTLYERVGNVNVLRVQTDNFNKPFSINEGTRLDLGSTSKLRTLTTYLDIVSELYDQYTALKTTQLRDELKQGLDPISSFVASAVIADPKISLTKLLEQAMERRYSANPGESFFTGGGVHHFENFSNQDNGRVATLTESLTYSLNLPFIRLMRDIVRYHIRRLGINMEDISSSRKSPLRMHFLAKFADQEGSHFMRQFYKKYKGRAPSEILPIMVTSTRSTAKHAAVIYRFVNPAGSVQEMKDFLRHSVKNANVTNGTVEKWYEDFAPGKFSLNDQGYLARIHPLELWLGKYLLEHPGSEIGAALEASKAERQQVYEWLFKTPHVRAQDIRIRTLMEVEAFLGIHKQWKKVGYPFNSMVPSLASAIGSSGDRPAALAELVGIILNDGIRYPLVRLEELHFAANTPFETKIRRADANQGERVLKPEVARTIKRAMANVVANGTARRVHNTFVRSDGKPYVIGGKTGTGDHRYETFGPGGKVISSRVVNRTATFAFYIGDRFFGVISAHVPGPEAAKFDFTSALAAELLKILAKSLVPMIESSNSDLSPFDNEPPLPTPTPRPTATTPTVKVENSTPAATPRPTPRATNTPVAKVTAIPTVTPQKATPAPAKTSEPTKAKKITEKKEEKKQVKADPRKDTKNSSKASPQKENKKSPANVKDDKKVKAATKKSAGSEKISSKRSAETKKTAQAKKDVTSNKNKTSAPKLAAPKKETPHQGPLPAVLAPPAI